MSGQGNKPAFIAREVLSPAFDDLDAHYRDLIAILGLLAEDTGQLVAQIIGDVLEESPLVKAYRLGFRLGKGSDAERELNSRRAPF